LGKRGPACSICTHKQRHQIEVGLVNQLSYGVLARRFAVSEDALGRHRREHLTPQVAAGILVAQHPSAVDLELLQRRESEGLLSSLIVQRSRLSLFSDAAMAAGDHKGAASIERYITANLDLTARLLGQLVTHHEVKTTSVLISADYLKLRRVIVEALAPFPEARAAVGKALLAIETEAAETLKADHAAGKPLMLEAKPAC
jgi:hypothetical protein